MKLYTEREITESLESMGLELMVNDFFQMSEPIELPSDRDIEIAANGNQEHYEGAMWLKYKYLTKRNNL